MSSGNILCSLRNTSRNSPTGHMYLFSTILQRKQERDMMHPYEKRHPSPSASSSDDSLWVRSYLYHYLYHAPNGSRDMFSLPSFLYGSKEDCGYGGKGGEVPGEVEKDGGNEEKDQNAKTKDQNHNALTNEVSMLRRQSFKNV